VKGCHPIEVEVRRGAGHTSTIRLACSKETLCPWSTRAPRKRKTAVEQQDDTIAAQCRCGELHKFSRRFAGRIAKCPKLGKRFRVPLVSGPVDFVATDDLTQTQQQQHSTNASPAQACASASAHEESEWVWRTERVLVVLLTLPTIIVPFAYFVVWQWKVTVERDNKPFFKRPRSDVMADAFPSFPVRFLIELFRACWFVVVMYFILKAFAPRP